MDQVKNRYCYVCGYDLSHDQDQYVKFGTTCPCCVFEYGIDDTTYGKNSFMKYRQEWINKGMPYGGVLLNSEVWNLEKAIKQLYNLMFVNINVYFLTSVIKENYMWTPEFDQREVVEVWKRTHVVS
jgi:hypothetical protein